MSLSPSTAKPATTVIPEIAIALPVVESATAKAPSPSRPRLRSRRWRSDRSTANSVAIAITSAPSAADIGLSSTPRIQRPRLAQPVASAVAKSGTATRTNERSTKMSTSATAASAVIAIRRRFDSSASFVFACAAITGSPATVALTPFGGFETRLRRSSNTSCCLVSGSRRTPNAARPARPRSAITAWRK